ncbi:MAG: hypothetical protein QXR26_04995 [Candidatus Caldarchaeum sp.]
MKQDGGMYKPLFYLEAKDGREVRITEYHISAVKSMGSLCLFLQAVSQIIAGGNGIVVDVVKPSPTGINTPTATEY